MQDFLRDDVDSAGIDATGEYPEQVLDELRRLGAFGMKIPKEYGGLGFTNVEYQKVMQLLGSADGNIVALLSAHQSIGVPQPLKLFGTPEQKKKYLPRCAAGEISAFALTEAHVGSDPARLVHHRGEDAGRRRLHPERHQALVHQRHHRQAARGDGRASRHPKTHQRLRGGDGLEGRARSSTARASWA